MNRTILGWLFIAHALGHTAIGVWTAGTGVPVVTTALWIIALTGYVAVGLALLRVPVLRDRWKALLALATGASMLICIGFDGLFGVLGVAIDVLLLILAADLFQRRIDAEVAVADVIGAQVSRHPRWMRAGWALGVAALAYVLVVALFRPVFLRWGTTAQERVAALAGDESLPADARYRVDHAITIHAPADSVWPWLAQIGQDRAGFYSYDWLERAFGDHVHNANRIHREWQQRAPGDTVLAAQPGYLGGRFGTAGWRVAGLVPGRALVLENWGSFVLQPIDSATTRLIVRTRGPGTPSVSGLVFSPFGVFVFEPAHFIMQRGMLRGIRDRAERAAATTEAGDG